MIATTNKLTEMQLELLRSFKHITDEKQLAEVKALLNFYFRKKLDDGINLEEGKRNYTEHVYEEWLNSSKK